MDPLFVKEPPWKMLIDPPPDPPPPVFSVAPPPLEPVAVKEPAIVISPVQMIISNPPVPF
jgi:hypothetical protein